MSDNILTNDYDLKTTTKTIFESMCNNEKIKEWFPEMHVIQNNDRVDVKELQNSEILYVARIEEAIPYSLIKGTIESLDGKTRQAFEWTIIPNEDVKNWCHLTTKTILSEQENKWKAIPIPAASATIGIVAYLSNGFTTMSSAYAISSTVISSAAIAPIVPQTIAVKATTSKAVLIAIVVSTVVAASGGIFVADAYYSDPLVEYSLYPAQLPAELHGSELTVRNVFSTDDKSEILDYSCNNESIVRGFEYTFDCTTKNSLGGSETIMTIIQIKEPISRLSPEAIDCVSQHYTLSDDMTIKYPYLSELPNISPSRLSNLNNNHIKMMDESYEDHDYNNAKKHATIVLKYFNINDVQTLSTLGNIMRDENRSNISGTECAINIHSTPLLSNTVWGKISLAEDYHVLGDYETSIYWSSKVIDGYQNNNPEIHEENYVNALIIKANALYRLALNEDKEFDEAKKHYIDAHNIRESYDTWFGLGNIDRHESNFLDAMEKYQQAKLLAEDTTEIDNAIQSIPSRSN